MITYRRTQEIFARYDQMLTGFLLGQGIHARGSTPEGLDGEGKPLGYRGEEGRCRGMIRLRQNERAVSTFRIAGGWFAIPTTGIALRYMVPSGDCRLMDFMGAYHRCVLAAATDETDAWLLLGDGSVVSSRDEPDDPGHPEKRRSVPLFDKRERIHGLARSYFPEQEIERQKRKLLLRGGIIRINGRFSACDYDTENKSFFRVFADGNMYHGYEVSYFVMSREEVLSQFAKYEDILQTEIECMEGRVPLIEIVSRLEDSGNPDYQPPEGYGEGVDFV